VSTTGRTPQRCFGLIVAGVSAIAIHATAAPSRAGEGPFRLVRSYPVSEATWAGTAGDLYLVAAQRALLVYRKTGTAPASMREVNRIVVGPEGRLANCQVEGGILYASAGAKGVLAYRIADLARAGAKPIWRSGPGLAAGPISASGGRIYAALEPGGLAVFDGATGKALGTGLREERLFGLNAGPSGVVYANTTTNYQEMAVIDARDPGALRVAARIRNDEYPTSYRFPGSIVGGLLLVAEMNGGVGVYDLSDPLKPRLASRFLATGADPVGRGGRPAGKDPIPRSVACEGTTVVIAAGTRIVRATLDGDRVVRGRALFEAQLEGGGLLNPQAVFLRDGVVAAPTAVDGVRFFDTQGARVAEIDLPSRIEGLAKVGRMVYATSDADGVWQFDWTARGGPKAVRRIEQKELSEDLLLHRDHLFVADGIGLGVIDVRDERNPHRVAYWDFPYKAQPDINEGWVEGVDRLGDTLFVACGPGGMAVFDVSAPATPRLLARVNPGTWGNDIAVEPRRKLAVYTGMDRFTLLDVSQPASPRILSSTPANRGRPTQGAAFSPDGTHLVVVAGGLFSVYDIRDPAAPKLLA